MNDTFLSNTYLVADEPGGHAVMIDAGGPVGPLLDYLRRGQLTLTHVLLTHHHHDHVSEVDQVLERYPGTPVLIHELERAQVPAATGTMAPGETIQSGALEIEPIHTPGHTAGMLSLLVNGTDVFTGDTLFKGSVGGVRAAGQHGLRGPQELDHGQAVEASAGHPRSTPVTPIRRRSRTSSSTTRSSGSGGASTPRGPSRAPRSASRPR